MCKIFRKKIVFVHIPKTAGVSVYEILEIPRSEQNHKTLSEKLTSPENRFSFTFVRNPWDRFVSCYFYLKKGGRGGKGDMKDQQLLSTFDSFEDFAHNFYSLRDKFSDRHFFPQRFWLDPKIDFVGRFENIDHDFQKLCQLAGIEPRILSHKNRAPRRGYREYYNPELVKIVKKIYEEDIAALNYVY